MGQEHEEIFDSSTVTYSLLHLAIFGGPDEPLTEDENEFNNSSPSAKEDTCKEQIIPQAHRSAQLKNEKNSGPKRGTRKKRGEPSTKERPIPHAQKPAQQEPEGNSRPKGSKRKRRGGPSNQTRKMRKLDNGITVQVALARKRANTLIVPNFEFLKASHQDSLARGKFSKMFSPPSQLTEWLDDEYPRRVMSGDGYDLVYYFPKGASQKETMSELLIKYGHALNVHIKRDRYHKANPNSYCQREGEISGATHLVRSWHGIGRSDLDLVVSQDFIQSGKSFAQSIQLLKELQIFSEIINSFLEHIDPTQHSCLQEARDKAAEQYAYIDMLNGRDPLLMEGRAILYNRLTPDHKDMRDPLVAWAALVVLGRITSGTLYFKQLNLRVGYTPGVLVWLRGALLNHEVEIWEGPQRIAIAHFTHQSYFDNLGLECKTGLGGVSHD